MQDGVSLKIMFGRQPATVWIMAFITMVGFLGIGLVDPILVSIAQGLNATPSQVSLLFTSYFAITSMMMLVTGVIFSRLGGKTTLLLGLFLIAVFSGLSGLSQSIEQLVLFRAGWGLGNALFIATALSTIVVAAVGAKDIPVLLYEAFLGLGISIGPLMGAFLGDINWRYPFFGTATLMLTGFLVCLFLLKQHKPEQPITFASTARTFSHRGLVLNALSAFFYNYGMFTLLAFVPFVLQLSAYAIGAIFFGWGLMLAIFSVFVAPRVKGRFGSIRLFTFSLLALAAVYLGICTGNKPLIIAMVVVAGAFMGLNNTAYTEIALEIAPVPRASASAAYNCIRWFAGVVAPYLAAHLGEHYGHGVPFLIAALCSCMALGIIYLNHATITALDKGEDDSAMLVPDQSSARPRPLAANLLRIDSPILVAVDASAATENLIAFVAHMFGTSQSPICIVHVRLIEGVTDLYSEEESKTQATALVESAVAKLKEYSRGKKDITGIVIDSPASRVPFSVYSTADKLHAKLIVIGARHKNNLASILRGSVSETVLRHATCPVLVLPEHDAVPVPAEEFAS